MYYKVINQESEVYKKLLKQRQKERAADNLNELRLEQILGFKWSAFWGSMGYQNLFRVNTYSAFKPEEGAVITKAVRLSSEHEGGYVPNGRTKKGKELQIFLQRGMETFNFRQVLNIVGLDFDRCGSFTIPFMEEVNGVVLLYLDDQDNPKDENVIEITRKEFDLLLNPKEIDK